MKNTTFVIGGCRSGKSSHALELSEKISGNNRIFIATCIPYDDEMKARVKKHKSERSDIWTGLEVPVKIADTIHEYENADVIVVDCLTLWVTNLLMDNKTDSEIFDYVYKLQQVLDIVRCPVILVANEVGLGIVPENQLSRRFRDLAGFVNQKIAACADKVVLMVAGIPSNIKG